MSRSRSLALIKGDVKKQHLCLALQESLDSIDEVWSVSVHEDGLHTRHL